MTYDLTYLSFGAGVQSTALLVCSNLGLHGVPRADVAIFADTGYEPQYVYEQVERMKAWSKIPVQVVRHNRPGLTHAIPAFTKNADGSCGILRRKCTSEWKIKPIMTEAKSRLGVAKGKRVPKSKMALALIGISLDEAHRIKPALAPWIDNSYPLVDARLRRSDCIRITEEAGLPKPGRSACYFCPFHSKAEWRDLRDNHHESWEKAVQHDRSIRDSTPGGLHQPVFLHRSLVPLDQVVLDRKEKPLFVGGLAHGHHEEEVDAFGNECEGMCGV